MDSSNSDICPFNSIQMFLVTITIHRVRNLPACDIETYVTLTLGNQKKKTPKQPASQNPYYNQYFSFEVVCRLEELRQKRIKITVFEVKKCCKDEVIGEVFVELNTIWILNKEHALFKKWVPLKSPTDSTTMSCSCGHIQLDMIIISQHDPPVPSSYHQNDCDDIDENNLLTEIPRQGGKIVKYIASFYKGDFVDKGDYRVEIGLGGIVARTEKTSRHSAKCEWNEKIVFQSYYPSLCQTFIIQILRKEFVSWKTYALKNIHFEETTFTSDNFPSIGPTYLNLYDTHDSLKYRGKILFSIHVESLLEFVPKLPSVISISPFFDTEYWRMQDFYINILIINAPLVHGDANKIQLQFRCGEMLSNQSELTLQQLTAGRWHSIKKSTFECLCAKIRLPDVRMKYRIDFYMNAVVRAMQRHVKNMHRVEHQVEGDEGGLKRRAYFWGAVCNLLTGELEQLMDILYLDLYKKVTQWDRNRVEFLRDFVAKKIELLKELQPSDSKKELELIEEFVKHFLTEFKNVLAKRLQDKWPDINLTIRSPGPQLKSTEFGVLKLNANKLSVSDSARYMGSQCGKTQMLLLKKSTCKHSCKHCDCIFGVLNLCSWILTDQQQSSGWTPPGYRLHDSGHWESTCDSFYHCNFYVHQAKISRPVHDIDEISDIKVQTIFGNQLKSTKTLRETISPVWNEMISFDCISMPGIASNLREYPPLFILELRNAKDNNYLMGTVFLRPSIRLLSNDLVRKITPIIGDNSSRNDVVDECAKDDNRLNVTTSSFEDIGTRMFDPNLNYLAKNIHDLFGLNYIFPPPLNWESIIRNGEVCGEILVSAELIQLSSKEPVPAALDGNILQIPKEISLAMKTFKLEFAFIGMRNAFLQPERISGRFRIEMNFGNVRLKSGPCTERYQSSFNFLNPYATAFISIPATFSYWPSLELKIMDCLQLASETSMGVTMIPNPGVFYLKPKPEAHKFQYSFKLCNDTVSINITDRKQAQREEPVSKISLNRFMPKNLFKTQPTKKESETQRHKQEQHFTWWAKFYNSMELTRCSRKHSLTIFDSELENLPQYHHFKDWAASIPMLSLTRFHLEKHNNVEHKLGDLRCAISVYEPRDNAPLSNIMFKQVLGLTEETKVSVLVYVVRGLAFRTRPIVGSLKSFVTVEYGGTLVKEYAHFVESQSWPIFGTRIQVNGMIPRDILLKISVYDSDDDVDELIGSTVVDIEDRLRTKFAAFCGLQSEYTRHGYNAWHQTERPTSILRNLCVLHNISPPVYVGNKIQLDNVTFEDSSLIECGECLRERLALSVLNQLNKVPSIGYNLIPDHVETRSLFRFDRPAIEQGKLQLWINVFEPQKIPTAVDIIPHAPRNYELRVIVRTAFIDMNVNLATVGGDQPVNVYVKGKLFGNVQCTDVHYGYGHVSGASFNWRMVFPCSYSLAEDMMILSAKKPGCPHRRVTPCFNVELWMCDEPSDMLLGSVSINLSYLTTHDVAKSKIQCSNEGVINLFQQKEFSGSFAVYGQMTRGEITQVGSVELDLSLISEEEATSKPAGRGREGPSPLQYPRDKNGFSPVKTLKCICLPILKFLSHRRGRWIFLTIILLKIFLIVLIVVGMKLLKAYQEGQRCVSEVNDFGIEETECV